MDLEVLQDVSLESFSGMATPSRAKFLVHVRSVEELCAAIQLANQRELIWRVLGEGSNTVFIRDFPGLIIIVRIMGISVELETSSTVQISVAAGENWHELVEFCVNNGWYGLENLALIPGLAGAAPIQNIGAYGVELKQFLDDVEYYDVARQQLCRLDNRGCNFSYRDSIFKNQLAGKVVITQLRLTLSKQAKVNVSYGSLAKIFKDSEPTPQQIFTAVCNIRREKLPLPVELPNCGSFFKNPFISREKYKELIAQYPDLVAYVSDGGYKLAAGWMIEKAGWKQKRHHSVRVHQRQALVIVNPENAKGHYVAAFAQQIQDDIEHRFGVRLEVEPNMI